MRSLRTQPIALKNALVLPIALFVCQSASAATITVNTAELLPSADDGLCTLTEAVEAANSNSPSGTLAGECAAGETGPVQDVIEFEPSLFPAQFFLVVPLNLSESIRIDGPGAEVMKVTNLAETRVFDILNVQLNAEFEIRGMTLQDNVLRAITGIYGGAIEASLSAGASLLLENMVFFNNTSERGGGAIGLFGGNTNSITIRNCLFEGNRAGNFGDGNVVGGGAIFVGADQALVIENSSFIDNQTFHAPLAQPQEDAAGGAILIRSGQTLTSTVDIFQSTFSGNSATGVGGAIALGGPGIPADISELSLRHSTIVLNESDSNDDEVALPGGGGVWSASSEPVQLFNSIVAQNIDNADSPAAEGLLQNDVDDDALIVIEVSPADQSRGALQAQVSATADGAFVFETLSADRSGLAEFTYVITDNISTASGSLFIEVLPVNDPPRFDAPTAQVSALPGAPTLVENWAIELGAGPADEQGQSLVFLISAVSVPAGFFTTPPSLAINGGTADLSFELAPDAAGSAVLSVVLLDDGGTANGGVNLSEEVLLTIEVLGDRIFSSRFEGE